MAYIYKITNLLNQKIYIGQTVRSVEERWRDHIREANKQRSKNRPLYRAFNKYGVDCFSIEQIEECPVEVVNERERYWIEHYQSFKHGYNATLGGDGTPYLDYDLIVATYKGLQSESKTAQKLKIDCQSVRRALREKKIKIISAQEVSQLINGKVINQYDKEGKYIQSFPSIKSAAASLGKITSTSNGASSHISDVCKGKRKTAYGFIWRFSE